MERHCNIANTIFVQWNNLPPVRYSYSRNPRYSKVLESLLSSLGVPTENVRLVTPMSRPT